MEADLKNYQWKKIEEVAHVERAVTGKVYQKGTILIALSASQGKVQILSEAKEVSNRYAVLEVYEGNLPEYIWLSIQTEFPEYIHKYQTGVNLQREELRHLVIPVHGNIETQRRIMEMMRNLEDSIRKEEEIIAKYRDVKEYYLCNMFV